MEKTFLLVLSACLLILSCTSVKQTIINPEKAKAIRTWAVVLHHESQKKNDEDKASNIITNEKGDTVFNSSVFTAELSEIMETDLIGIQQKLSLIDRIKFTLEGKYKIPLKEKENADGIILVSTFSSLSWSYQTFETIFVRFLNKNGEILAQIEIENNGLYTKKDMKGMSKLAAEKIAETIKSF